MKIFCSALASIILCSLVLGGCATAPVPDKPASPVAETPPATPLEDITPALTTKEAEPSGRATRVEPLPEVKPEQPKETPAVMLTIKRDKSSTNVRSVPSTQNNKPIARLKGGTEVEKIDEKGAWYKIRFVDVNGNQKEGWINESRIEK